MYVLSRSEAEQDIAKQTTVSLWTTVGTHQPSEQDLCHFAPRDLELVGPPQTRNSGLNDNRQLNIDLIGYTMEDDSMQMKSQVKEAYISANGTLSLMRNNNNQQTKVWRTGLNYQMGLLQFLTKACNTCK